MQRVTEHGSSILLSVLPGKSSLDLMPWDPQRATGYTGVCPFTLLTC